MVELPLLVPDIQVQIQVRTDLLSTAFLLTALFVVMPTHDL